jgi:signal transduction histidine kinase
MMGVTDDTFVTLVSKNEGNVEEKENDVGWEDEHPIIKRMAIADEFQKLRPALKLRDKMVREYMHNAMSPISAISGYLELMQMFLQDEVDAERVEKYRSKIQKGISELSDIIEDLYDECDNEEELSEDSSASVEIKRNRRAG